MDPIMIRWTLLALFMAWAGMALAQPASMTSLGDLPGGTTRSVGYGISRDGSWIAGSSFSPSGEEAIRSDGLALLGLGDLSGGSFGSIGYAVSNTGLVVGIGTSSSGFEGFRATPMTGMGDLPGGSFSSTARAVTPNGAIIVGIGTGTSGSTAWRWQGAGLVALADLPGGTLFSEAHGVSDDGLVIVGRSSSAAGSEACFWSAGTVTPLGDLSGGAVSSVAFATNADGSVHVGWGTSSNGQEATRWALGVPTGLGDLSGGTFSSIAYGVSADGQVVVGSGTGPSAVEAFIWTAGMGMRRLRDVLVVDMKVTGLTNWGLIDARAISADGRRIVGTGLNPTGNREAVVIQLPPRGAISGWVQQSGYTGSLAWATFSLELLTPGTQSVVFQQNFLVDSQRNFSVPTSLRGTFDVAIQGPAWLRKRYPNVVISDLGSPWIVVNLVPGDADGDNEVTNADYSIWAFCNGASLGEPLYDPRVDWDGDGEVTNADYSIWASQNGQVGD